MTSFFAGKLRALFKQYQHNHRGYLYDRHYDSVHGGGELIQQLVTSGVQACLAQRWAGVLGDLIT
jgi:hypothetical protein